MEIIAAFVAIASTFCGLISLAFAIYASQKKLPLALATLRGCRIIADTCANFTALGPAGKFLALSTTALALLFPGIFARKNLVDLKEIDALPRSLRRWIVLPMSTGWASVAIMFIAGFWIDY